MFSRINKDRGKSASFISPLVRLDSGMLPFPVSEKDAIVDFVDDLDHGCHNGTLSGGSLRCGVNESSEVPRNDCTDHN